MTDGGKRGIDSIRTAAREAADRVKQAGSTIRPRVSSAWEATQKAGSTVRPHVSSAWNATQKAGSSVRPHVSSAWNATQPARSVARAGSVWAGRHAIAWTLLFIERLRSTIREALATRRRPPTVSPAHSRRFGLLGIELWTVVVSAIFAVFVFLDGPTILWARGLDRGVIDLFRTVTDLGKSDWLLVPTGILILFLAARPLAAMTRRGRAQVEAWLGLLGFGFMVVAGSGLVVTILKRVIGRARPKHFDTAGVFDFSPFALDASYASFPSGHATTLFAFAAVIAFIAPKLRWPALALALWLALSRVVIGSHYPSDAIAGAAFALWFALRARAMFAENGLVFDRDATGRYRLKSPRLLASIFVSGRTRSIRSPQPEPAE